MQQRNNVQTLSCCDDDQAWAASRNRTNGRKKSLTLGSIDNQRPRDLLMYKQTDLLKNIELENSKEARMKMVNRMKDLRKMGTSISIGGTFSSSIAYSLANSHHSWYIP